MGPPALGRHCESGKPVPGGAPPPRCTSQALGAPATHRHTLDTVNQSPGWSPASVCFRDTKVTLTFLLMVTRKNPQACSKSKLLCKKGWEQRRG